MITHLFFINVTGAVLSRLTAPLSESTTKIRYNPHHAILLGSHIFLLKHSQGLRLFLYFHAYHVISGITDLPYFPFPASSSSTNAKSPSTQLKES